MTTVPSKLFLTLEKKTEIGETELWEKLADLRKGRGLEILQYVSIINLNLSWSFFSRREDKAGNIPDIFRE